jgi:Flp pilus assembly protein TadG
MSVSGRWIDRLRLQAARFARDRGGAMAMTLALMTTSFAGMVALSVDVSDWYGTKRAMQSAADAGALGGELQIYQQGTSAQAIAAGTTDAQLNATGLAAGATVSVTVDPNSQAVTATLTKQANVMLAGIFLGSAPTITVSATAGLVTTSGGSGTPYCLLITSPTSPSGSDALVVTGGSHIQASGCNAVVNSTAQSGLTNGSASSVNNGSTITDKSICGPGAFYHDSSTYNAAPTACNAVSDPLASLTAPSNVNGACTYNNYSIDSSNSLSYTDGSNNAHSLKYQSAFTMSPGVYCGGIALNGSAPVTMQAGIYIVRGGSFSMTNSSPTVSGTGVSIYLTGNGSLLNVSNGTLTISAPTTGSMAGISIYEDHSSTTGTINNYMTNSGVVNSTGVMYFGNQNVIIGGGFQSKPSSYTILVAYTLNISNGSTLYLNSNYSGTTVPVPTQMYPTTQVVALTQ